MAKQKTVWAKATVARPTSRARLRVNVSGHCSTRKPDLSSVKARTKSSGSVCSRAVASGTTCAKARVAAEGKALSACWSKQKAARRRAKAKKRGRR